MSHPNYYDPNKVGVTGYVPNVQRARQEGRDLYLQPYQEDTRKVLLLLVDPQIDFIHEDGNLAVPGAVDDTRRTIEWINRNVSQLTAIACSLDTHIPDQIFFPSWWEDEDGEEPDPFTPITADDVDNGVWSPRYDEKWSKKYVHELESAAKKTLMIWPYHTLLGTPGHAISPVLYEAITYHAGARLSCPAFIGKGTIKKTEHYSLLEPEVKVPDQEGGTLNTIFLDQMREYDLVYVAGQAKSHCVLETVTSVMRYYENYPEEIAKWRILMDCMSSVAHPDIDFEALSMDQYQEYERKGLQLVTSMDSIG